MFFRSSGVPFAIALGLAAAACSAAGDDAPEHERVRVGERREAILDGYPDDADKAVVGVYNLQISGLCSGSLIAPNVVLTARHCVSEITGEVEGGVACNSARFVGAYEAAQFVVTTSSEMMNVQSLFHTVREVALLPSPTSMNEGVCGNDQALLILSEPVAAREAAPLVPRIDVPLTAGEAYYAVGYGATGDDGVGAGLRRRRDALVVDCVADACRDRSVSTTEWVGDIGTCQGDSGGPSLDLQNRVIGITSRGSSGCDNPIYGAVSDRAAWLKETAVRAAALGGYPPPPWATDFPTDPAYVAEVGGACEAPADCPANACLDRYCTRPCNGLAACPDGYRCDGDPGFCAKDPEPTAYKDPDDDSASCSVLPGPDPTTPISWPVGAVGLGAVAVLRRLRRRRARAG